MFKNTFVTELVFGIFANLQVGEYVKYCISLNKDQDSNKCHPLISTAPNSFKI